MAACATKPAKPQFTWYQEALSVGGVATHTGLEAVSGEMRKLEDPDESHP